MCACHLTTLSLGLSSWKALYFELTFVNWKIGTLWIVQTSIFTDQSHCWSPSKIIHCIEIDVCACVPRDNDYDDKFVPNLLIRSSVKCLIETGTAMFRLILPHLKFTGWVCASYFLSIQSAHKIVMGKKDEGIEDI